MRPLASGFADSEYRQHYRTHRNHAAARSGHRASRVSRGSVRSKKRGGNERGSSHESHDPNDRLNALATYISVYA